jgi:hypothetical protein
MATLQERRLGYHSRAGLEPGTSGFSILSYKPPRYSWDKLVTADRSRPPGRCEGSRRPQQRHGKLLLLEALTDRIGIQTPGLRPRRIYIYTYIYIHIYIYIYIALTDWIGIQTSRRYARPCRLALVGLAHRLDSYVDTHSMIRINVGNELLGMKRIRIKVGIKESRFLRAYIGVKLMRIAGDSAAIRTCDTYLRYIPAIRTYDTYLRYVPTLR